MHTKLALIFTLALTPAFAGNPSPESVEIQPTERSTDWWLSVTPYSWLTATEGDMGVAGRVAPVDISMKDALDDLEIAFMLAAEAGFDRWAFGIDAIYGEFSDGGALPPGAAPFTNATVDFDQFFGRIHAGYQVVKEDNLTLTTFVGARYSYLATEIVLSGGAPPIAVDGSKSWVDPIIGLHGNWAINDFWFIQGGGDIGGFGVSSDLIWQANIALGFRIYPSTSILIGYRGLGVDYTDGGFLVDTVAHGPVIGLSIRF